MSKNIIVKVNNLQTSFYQNEKCNKAVNGVSFDIIKGETLCIVGESGCGKSVTASSIMRLLPDLSRIEEGEIIYYRGNEEIRIDKLDKNGKEMRKIRGEDIAMIFQDPMTSLNPVYTIGAQIKEMIKEHKKGITEKEAHTKVIELLKSMGIPLPEQRINEYPFQFSGGMRQRAMIALAMACSPKVLIADEPTTALDVTVQAQIFELMNKLKEEHETAIMLITHDMGVVSELADTVCVMYMGSIIEKGTSHEVLKQSKHPYTIALINSIPILGRKKDKRLEPIRGSTPDPYNRPVGCQFGPRCDFYIESKCNVMPKETLIDGTHYARCWLVGSE